MNDRPRVLGRFAWLLPLAVLAIALALMPSDGRERQRDAIPSAAPELAARLTRR